MPDIQLGGYLLQPQHHFQYKELVNHVPPNPIGQASLTLLGGTNDEYLNNLGLRPKGSIGIHHF